MAIRVIIGEQHFGHAGQFGSLSRSSIATRACDQHMHFAKRSNSSKGFRHGIRRQSAFVYISNQQNGHQITPASSLSFAISSSTEPTLTPALRPAGSTVFTMFRRGVTSTPKSAGVFSAIGLALAFMMFGSDA